MPAADPTAAPLSADQIATIDAYWRACCYLAVGMIYLRENSLLREPLQGAHLKHRLLGHWGGQPRALLHVRASEPQHPRAEPGGHLPGGTRPLRAGPPGPGLLGRALLRDRSPDPSPPRLPRLRAGRHADRCAQLRLRERRGQARVRRLDLAAVADRISPPPRTA